MKPIYKKDRSVGLGNHGGCIKAFCPQCGGYLGEYDIRDCACGGWWLVDGTGEYEVIPDKRHNRPELTLYGLQLFLARQKQS